MTLKTSSNSKLPEIKLSLSWDQVNKNFSLALTQNVPNISKSIKALSTSPDDCSIPLLIDSATSNEVKVNGDKAELLNHTFVSHFNTVQKAINHTDIPPVNPEDS